MGILKINIGLREGEKLFEELLIDSKSENNPPINLFANEPKLVLMKSFGENQ